MTITQVMMRAWGACWDDEKVAQYVPAAGIEPLDVFGWKVPALEKIWVLLHREVLGDALEQVALPFARSVVARYCLFSVNPIIEGWACDWWEGQPRAMAEDVISPILNEAIESYGKTSPTTWAIRAALRVAQGNDSVRAAAAARGARAADRGNDDESEARWQLTLIRQTMTRR